MPVEPPRPPPSTLNLDTLAGERGLEVKLAPPESPDEARARRHREMVIFYFALALLLAAVVGVTLLFVSTTSPEEKRWSMATLSAIVSFALGVLVGKKAL